jgi:hypothetical protein
VAKKHSKSAQVDRQAINLCASIVGDMKHIWREITVSDVGIDAEIELVDPATDNATGRLLLVQSKGRTAPFDRETDDSFTFRCSPEDLEYWMTATAPVLLVCSHPAQRLAWFKNLHVWFDDPQRRRARTVEFDKKADSLDVSASQRLLDWAVPASTGIYLQPPPKAESLATNLLRVEHLGPYIYAAPSDVRGWSDVNARLRAAGRDLVDDVAWRSNTLFSFRRLDQPPLDALVDDAPERFDVEEFAEAESDDDRHLVVRLLNNTLKDMFRGHLSWHRDRQFFYFPATADLQPRKVRVDKRGTGRTVFQRYSSEDASDRSTYYRHYALRAQFQRIDEGWVLALEPTYHFTVDGRTESRYAPELLSGIKRLERQQAVAHLVRFWAGYLRGDYDLFSTRDPRIRFGTLAQVDVDRGIDDAYWKPDTSDIAVGRGQPETSATGQSSMFEDS